MLVRCDSTAAFRDTMFKAMGQQLCDAVLWAWGTMPSVKWVFTDMQANPEPQGRLAEQAVCFGTSGKTDPVAQPTNFDSHLIEAYTFDSYCEGHCAIVLREYGALWLRILMQTFNPFFLYGPRGVRRTW